jgi:hypothetical protein
MSSRKNKMRGPLRTILLVAILTVSATVFLCPTSEPGAIWRCDLPHLYHVEDIKIIRLAPIFGKQNQKLYSIRLSPNLSKFARSHPEFGRVCLMKQHVAYQRNGTLKGSWRYALDYWFLVCLVPGVILGVIISLILRNRV